MTRGNPFSLRVQIALVALFLSACSPGNTYPLAEPGSHDFGTHQYYEFTDTSRDGREVFVMVWYPAELPADAPPSDYNYDAKPDLSGAPYPLIMSSAKVGSVFGPHLASHGFIVAGISGQDSSNSWGNWLVDYPLDILFALDQIAASPLPGLEGMVNAQQAGAMGYSFDGYTSLALSGARVDPDFYLAQCTAAPTMTPQVPEWWIEYTCALADKWSEFSSHAGKSLTNTQDGLWQPMTDERILAVMPMAPEGAWLFGPRGLAAVDRPTLMIGAAADEINLYDLEAVFIFEHLGTPDKALISFVGEDHMMVTSDAPVAKMKHFATAFFGTYLQGRSDYAEYFSKKFVSRRENLAWGVYKKK